MNTAELRTALAAPPTDNTILLDPGIYRTQDDGGGTFTVNNAVTLEAAPGGSAANVIIDGSGMDRVFNVTAAGTVTFQGLTIRNGSTIGTGAGIQSTSGAILQLTNSAVSGNTSTGSSGGGIWASGGAINLLNSQVNSNHASGGGGGIDAEFGASVDLVFSQVNGNTASGGNGGGILAANGGTVTLSNSTVDGNVALFNGGGLELVNADLHISGSTISNNTAGGNAILGLLGGNGGGIDVEDITDPTVTLVNSTVSSNTANSGEVNSKGGGISTSGMVALTLTNVTVTNNSANTGGGIFSGVTGDAASQLLNTIVAQNTATATAPDVSGPFVSLGHNLIGDATGSTGFTNGMNGDQVGGNGNPVIQALLGPLQNNGGPTLTHALLPGSPAIDTGNDVVLTQGVTTDQRGVSRPQGAHVDIGAYELLQAAPAAPTAPQSSALAVTSFNALQALETDRGFALIVSGLNFTPDTLVTFNGRVLSTNFVNGTTLEIFNFVKQVQKPFRLRIGHHIRLVHFDDGVGFLRVLGPNGATQLLPFTILEIVAPGQAGTPLEQFIAQLWENHHRQEADISPAFQALLRILRAHGI